MRSTERQHNLCSLVGFCSQFVPCCSLKPNRQRPRFQAEKVLARPRQEPQLALMTPTDIRESQVEVTERCFLRDYNQHFIACQIRTDGLLEVTNI